jgi:hypothetical protein
MTPQEKAIELYNKMYALNEDDFISEYISKATALIAVEEIIASHYKVLTGINNSILEYWIAVQQEIKKL